MTTDPELAELRKSLGRFRRRVWLRRMVRHGSFILAGVVAAQLVLAVIARLFPIEWHALAAAAIVVIGVVAFIADAIRIRPSLAEAAIAVDSEDGLKDRGATALSIATRSDTSTDRPDSSGDE